MSTSMSLTHSKTDTAKVFNSGNSQAVRLPKAYRVDADKLYIQKVGDSIMLTPIDNRVNTWTDKVNHVFALLKENADTPIEVPLDLPNDEREDISFHQDW